MIFVTVGTHEQPFNRLIQKVDELKKEGVITEDVIIQTGFSTYEPKYCQWSKLIPYQQMIKNVADARIVVAQQVLLCRFRLEKHLLLCHGSISSMNTLMTIRWNLHEMSQNGWERLLKWKILKPLEML